MQNPTCTGIRIRSARDANILFHAVALNLLPLITRRLDEAERLQVKSGCVYVWEERNPSYFDFNGQEMKRFTEGASIPALCPPPQTNSVPPAQVNSPAGFIRKELGPIQGQRCMPPGSGTLWLSLIFRHRPRNFCSITRRRTVSSHKW
jgi:hypothetical protein